MKASQLIEELQALVAQHGDAEVITQYDSSVGEELVISPVFIPEILYFLNRREQKLATSPAIVL